MNLNYNPWKIKSVSYTHLTLPSKTQCMGITPHEDLAKTSALWAKRNSSRAVLSLASPLLFWTAMCSTLILSLFLSLTLRPFCSSNFMISITSISEPAGHTHTKKITTYTVAYFPSKRQCSLLCAFIATGEMTSEDAHLSKTAFFHLSFQGLSFTVPGFYFKALNRGFPK